MRLKTSLAVIFVAGAVTACGAVGAGTPAASPSASAVSSATAVPSSPPVGQPHVATSAPVPTAAPLPTPHPTSAPTMVPAMQRPVVMTSNTALGLVLAAVSNGRTVYTFDSDIAGSGKSNCNGTCGNEWPPVTIARGTVLIRGPSVTGRLGTIIRLNGAMQLTYDGLPLYFFSGDSGPGQTHGNYTGWSLVKV